MKIILSIFFLSIFFETEYSQSINWKSIEFNIGKLMKIEVNKNNEIFALSDSGLYKSKDNGITWRNYIKNKGGSSFLNVNWFSLQSHFSNGIITNEYLFPGGNDLNLINTYLTMYDEEADSLKYLGKFPVGVGDRSSAAHIERSMFVNNKIYLIRWSNTQHGDINYYFLKNYGNPEYWVRIPTYYASDFYVKPNNDIIIYRHNGSSDWWPKIHISIDGGGSWSDNIIGPFDQKVGEITSLIYTQKNTLIYLQRFWTPEVFPKLYWEIVRMPELKSANIQYSSLEQDTLININYNESTQELSLLSLKYLYISNDGVSWKNVNHDSPFNNAIGFNISPEGTYYVCSSDKIFIGNKTTGITKEEFGNPVQYWLEQNYPNPFNPITQISYSLKQKGNVTLQIYNTLGQKISDLVNQQQEAGKHTVTFDGSALPSGVYFYRIQSNGFSDTKKLMLLK